MKRQNNEKCQEELNDLNRELGEVLEQIPINGQPEQQFEAVEEKEEKRPANKKKRAASIATGILAGIFAVFVIIFCGFMGLRMSGKKALMANSDLNITAPDLAGQEISVEDNGDLVVYNGQKYCYNHNIITVLCLGIDQRQDETLKNREQNVLVGDGQADTIILAAIDSESGKTSLLNISRDSMTDVDLYTPDGHYAGGKNMQLCLAYAYGKGEKGGVQNVARSVSRLLYGIPVSSYAAINLSAINVLNDAVDGVEVDVIEDLSVADPELQLGKRVTLRGRQAETYVRSRDAYSGDPNSNSLRMDRQKQYLSSFVRKTLLKTKEDISVPLTLFDVASEYMVTDLNAARVSYLVSLLNNTGLEDSGFLTVPGESVIGNDGYAEYHVEDKTLYEMILNVFYKKSDK